MRPYSNIVDEGIWEIIHEWFTSENNEFTTSGKFIISLFIKD